MTTTYYDQPVLKAPVWKWNVPAYFFTGGLAAGTSLLAAGARLTGDDQLRRRCLAGSMAATVASTVLLVDDLGRPARFLNMLRVAKPTSPMSIGSWVLAAFGGATTVAAAGEIFDGLPRRAAPTAHAVAAALAPVLATYTAVLIADTAIPAWHDARSELPFVFAGSALASSGGFALLVSPSVAARRAAILGAAVELAAAKRMERHLASPLTKPSKLSKLAAAATAAGALLATRSRRVAGVLLLAGALAERFAVFQAGVASARDPAATIGPQRRRLNERAWAGPAPSPSPSPFPSPSPSPSPSPAPAPAPGPADA